MREPTARNRPLRLAKETLRRIEPVAIQREVEVPTTSTTPTTCTTSTLC